MRSLLLLLALLHLAVAAAAINAPRSPFLSATLSARITSVSPSIDFNDDRKTTFSETLTAFLTKIFRDQQVYHVTIIAVNVFDDHLLRDGKVVERQASMPNSNGQHTLSFSTVVSAEYTQESDIDSIPADNFRKMLIHVCDKFQDHLIGYMHGSGDPYFSGVERVVLADFERVHSQTPSDSDEENASNETLGMSNDTLNTASIVAIVLGSIAFAGLMYASWRHYRKEQVLEAYRFRSKEISSAHTSLSSAGMAKQPMTDDYSFNPSGSSPGARDVYHDSAPSYTGYKDDPPRNRHGMHEEQIDFAPSRATPHATLFPAPGTNTVQKATLSYTEELNNHPRQHIFAPPGKIGVAIDVVNGQPVVHKVRRGSPVENLLRPNDVLVAIDDEDASCMSAADVTSMMARRMDRVRKITFIRRGG
ncbi:hypothetical protein ACHAXT_011692 [Thalassiosira profunda]